MKTPLLSVAAFAAMLAVAGCDEEESEAVEETEAVEEMEEAED